MNQFKNGANLISTDEIQAEIYSKMSFARKWEEFLRMREAAWLIKSAGLRSQNKDWSEQKIQDKVKKIFLYAST
ncbi:MAG TPA: hypothetical protein PLJ21_04905 [Pseudobdellovibrionaceae bacterium]|nr:hypothetical protein [Pseudobdellovibrionaceae bacterium]